MFEQFRATQTFPITMFSRKKQRTAGEPMQSTSRDEPEPTTFVYNLLPMTQI